MGTRAELTIKDDNDFISMNTRWDGYDDFVLKKLNKEKSILKLRSKLDEFIKGKKRDSQIEFLENWIASIDRFLAGKETISKVANLITFGDFSHFNTTVENIDFNNKNNIDANYIIEKVNGSFKFIFNDEKIEECLEYEEEEVTKESYLKNLKNSKYIAYVPKTQKYIEIQEKPLETDDLLIKIYNGKERDEHVLLPEDFLANYIKMKKGSVEKFAEIVQTLAFNYAYLYEVGEFSLNKLMKVNEIRKKVKELEEQGINYSDAYKKVVDKLNLDDVNLGFNAEYSVNCFSFFKREGDSAINKALENVDKGLEPAHLDNFDKELFSYPPFEIYPETLIHQLVFFYPDMFEVLTASEMKYVVSNEKAADINCKLIDEGTCKIIVDFKGLLTNEKLVQLSDKMNKVEKYISESFNQELVNIALENREGVNVSWSKPLIEGSKMSYDYILAILSTMNAYDNYLFKKNCLSLNNNNVKKMRNC